MFDQEKTKFYFLNIDFGESRTGIENASLLRANLFYNHLNINPTMVTTQYNPRLNLQREKLYAKGLLAEQCKIINLYEYFQDTIPYNNPVQHDQWNKNDDWTYQPVNGTKDHRIYNEQNQFIYYRKCSEDGFLLYNNVFVGKKKVRRDAFDSNGYLSKMQYLDQEHGNITSETYFHRDGYPCILKYFNYQDGKNELVEIQLLARSGEVISVFHTEMDFIAYWLKLLFDDSLTHFLIIDKERVYFPALMKLNLRNVFIVCMIHSSHLKTTSQDILIGQLNSNYKPIFDNISKADAIVVFTNRQKDHIEKRFGALNQLYVIPHSVETIRPANFETRKPKTAVYLARYSDEKCHERLVRIFDKVINQHPSARLEFYGSGEKKSQISKQVRDLGREQSILVNGYAMDVNAIYNQATLAILPSKSEGFSLFLLESISHGCPVISFDVDYGSADMIDSGVNGYLIEQDNEDLMAQQIISLLDDPGSIKAMSAASYLKAESFKSENIAKMWMHLIINVLNK